MREMDWTEDFKEENGNYTNQCSKCLGLFTGHKRRLLCKACWRVANAVDASRTKTTAADLLTAAAETYRSRNAVYGNNFLVVGRVMAALFPDGLQVKTIDDWNRLHIFLLQIVKITRYVQNWEKGGHKDSMHDLAVYAAMLESIDDSATAEPELGLTTDAIIKNRLKVSQT